MNVRKLIWESNNGKYKVLARHFEGDVSPAVGYWKLSSNGKFRPVKYNSLPAYVKNQIKVLEQQIMLKP